MHYTKLQCTATPFTAMYFTTLHCVESFGSVGLSRLWLLGACYPGLLCHCTALLLCTIALHCSALCTIALHCTVYVYYCIALHCHCILLHCAALPGIALHCIILKCKLVHLCTELIVSYCRVVHYIVIKLTVFYTVRNCTTLQWKTNWVSNGKKIHYQYVFNRISLNLYSL